MIDKLLLVDPICHTRAPTMRSWLKAATEVLPGHFREIEIWSMENGLDLPGVKWRKFPKVSPFWPIQSVIFRYLAWRAYRKIPQETLKDTLIQCSGEHLPTADIRYIHFWNHAYSATVMEKPGVLSMKAREKFFLNLTLHLEKKILQTGATGEWWCVSRGIAAPIEKQSPPGSRFELLPNSYEPTRFNKTVASTHRERMRAHYGFSDEETVIVFCSFGHFVRKGLLQAIEVTNRLRDAGNMISLLILGGTEKALQDFKKLLSQRGLSMDGIHFAGLVNPPEEHLSAGDALFFPSHFEAFSLVEIEAAALGLRLYLTEHPGSEMILRENTNGRLLPWDIEGMTRVFQEEIESGAIRSPHDETGEALTPVEFRERLSFLYANAIRRKSSRFSQ